MNIYFYNYDVYERRLFMNADSL